MSLHSESWTHYSDSKPTSVFALSSECCVLSKEATNTNLIVIGVTQSGLEPTTYHTQDQHANHYTIDAVIF